MADNIVGQLRTAAIMQRHKEVYCPDLLREAAAEIERLRARVAELLPFAHGDAKSGASVAHWPGGHNCEPICEDCQWHLDSVALLARIEAGEFGPLNNSW